VEIPTVTIHELGRKVEAGDAFVLVDALAPMVYAHSHLPGAINLPPAGLDPELVARRIPDRDAEIIVYCTSPDCDDSIETAKRLRALGYTNVRRYAGGKNEWREAGRPLERAGRPFVPRVNITQL
jgi:rhodanese-related sulfurtransferase